MGSVAVAVVARDGRVLGQHGPLDRAFGLASVTKPLSAYAVLLAVEEGALGLDDPAGPPGSTVRHLLAHASGCHPDERRGVTEPGRRRVYSNAAYDWLGALVAERTGLPFADYLAEGVLAPLGMAATRLEGSPAAAGVSTVADMVRFLAELQAPRLLHPSTLQTATTVAFPGLAGLLPGFGKQDPNDWGLGFEIRNGKFPHWTGADSGPATFGHFGRSGTFLWVDPVAGAGCVCLTDREFDDWSRELWPPLTDGVLAELAPPVT